MGLADGLSNTVVVGQRPPYLADTAWAGIIPGARHSTRNQFAASGTGGDYGGPASYLLAHSGPSMHENPPVIRPPNSPLGHSDAMYALHPRRGRRPHGRRRGPVINQTINLAARVALSAGSGGEVLDASTC